MDGLNRAHALVEQANHALAEAATILRSHPDLDDLAFAAMRLEGETGILSLRISRVPCGQD